MKNRSGSHPECWTKTRSRVSHTMLRLGQAASKLNWCIHHKYNLILRETMRSLLETPLMPHEEADPALPRREAWSLQACSHLVANWPGLSTAGRPLGLLWPKEGGIEAPGEGLGVWGSWVEFLLPHNHWRVQRRSVWERVILSVWFNKKNGVADEVQEDLGTKLSASRQITNNCYRSTEDDVNATHFTLTLVQMIYSISSEKGFWNVKELVLIQIHSLTLERNRNITDRTWPFSFTTWGHAITNTLTKLHPLTAFIFIKRNENSFDQKF